MAKGERSVPPALLGGRDEVKTEDVFRIGGLDVWHEGRHRESLFIVPRENKKKNNVLTIKLSVAEGPAWAGWRCESTWACCPHGNEASL